jgi:D-aminopeptidase
MRARLRDLGIAIGPLPTGPLNAITDVPGVLVGQVTLVEDQPRTVRTGLTVIVPRDGQIGKDYAFAGFHRFNGCGEMTGVHWLEETGLLSSAIGLTNTLQVGMVRDALSEYSWTHPEGGPYFLPVVAETYDGWLNDLGAHALNAGHVAAAMQSANAGPVAEGNTGGGTGMICHDFKAGTGTSSRRVETAGGTFTIGALVQTNYGDRALLRVDGFPVGREIGFDQVPDPWITPPQPGEPGHSSIIIILATDAPLLPMQRATVGLALTGGTGHDPSGDLFLAFATGNHIPASPSGVISLQGMLANQHMDPLVDAVPAVVEESILNALCAAETMTGQHGRVAHALPLDRLQAIWQKYHPA